MDNDDKICGSWNYNGGGWGDPWDWAWAPWQVGGSSAVSDYFNATDEEKQEGVKKGVLYPYTRSVDCYHCPSDKSFGRNFRTYSMPDSLNGKWAMNKGGTANWTDVSHLSQLKNPATKYVFLEENDPRGYNIKSNETLRIFRDIREMSQGQRTPQTEGGIRDLERIQRSWPEPRGLSGLE